MLITRFLQPEFEKRNVKVLALSVDEIDEHAGWVEDIKDTQGVADVTCTSATACVLLGLCARVHGHASVYV